jgi:hypothetical protein
LLAAFADGSCSEIQAAIAAQVGAIPALVGLLGSGNEEVQGNAAAALAHLAKGSCSNQDAIAAQPGAVSALVLRPPLPPPAPRSWQCQQTRTEAW